MNSFAAIPSVFDLHTLGGLKSALRKDDPQALKAAAQQFEALFLEMMLKSMRATVPQEGPFESDQTRFYQELLDAQLAQVLATKGGSGLARLIEQQMAQKEMPGGEAAREGGLPLNPPLRSLPLKPPQHDFPLQDVNAPQALPLEGTLVRPAALRAESLTKSARSAEVQAFAASMWPHALLASRQTGIPPQFLIAHAALESGWGRFEPRYADGRPSHNLFGIKAGSGWSGAVVESVTTEFVNGVAERRIERFRAYDSYAAAFADYARLLRQRYGEALTSRDALEFAQALQRGGYATDPAYVEKLLRVIAQLA